MFTGSVFIFYGATGIRDLVFTWIPARPAHPRLVANECVAPSIIHILVFGYLLQQILLLNNTNYINDDNDLWVELLLHIVIIARIIG